MPNTGCWPTRSTERAPPPEPFDTGRRAACFPFRSGIILSTGERGESAVADGTNDNRSPGGILRLRASPWALLLPTAVITAGYGLLLLILSWRGLGDSAVARLCMVVLGFAVPFIAAHAVLRLITVEVRPMGHALVVRRGFPQAGAVEVPWDDISRVSVRRGPGGRLTGSGTLVIARTDGRRIAVADIDAPLAAAAHVRRWAGEAVQGGGTGAANAADAEQTRLAG